MSLFRELKRRNVFRVGAAYLVIAWLIIQVVETLFPVFELSNESIRLVVLVLAFGFLPALVLAWVFEYTPEGLRRERDIDRSIATGRRSGKKLDRVFIVVLTMALALFAWDKFLLDPARDKALLESARQEAAQSSANAEREKSVAVLPFVNRSNNEEDAYFTDGMHDELLTHLSRIAALKVTSRTSVLQYRNSEKAIPQIAGELGVGTVLEGGVQRIANTVRVNVQLIDGVTDDHLWAEIYDRKLTADNLFAIQSDITRAIADALQARLTPEENRALDAVPTQSLEAYDAYIAGLASKNGISDSDLQTGVEKFTLATELDPRFAAAWAGLCESRLYLYQKNSDPANFEAAESACERALELDSSVVHVHIAQGMLYRYKGLSSRAEVSLKSASYNRAEQALQRALSIDALNIEALLEYGLILTQQGRLEEAEAKLLTAAELDPRYWPTQTSLFNFYSRYSEKPDHYELAAEHAVIAASLRPDLAASWNNVGTAKYMLMQYEEATDAWKHSLEIEPTRTAYTNSGLALEDMKRYTEAAEMQQKAIEMAPEDHRTWGRLARVQSLLQNGQEEAAKSYAKAAELVRRKLSINNRNWRDQAYLASYLSGSGETEEALATADLALEMSDRHPEALLRASGVYRDAGQEDKYRAMTQEMVEKDPAYALWVTDD